MARGKNAVGKSAGASDAHHIRMAVRHTLAIEPLPATFTLISILGLIITTVFTVSGRVPLSWGVAFDVVFAIMFIASMISITPRFAGWD